MTPAQVGVIMGGATDFETLGHAAETLAAIGIAQEVDVVSAHPTPERMVEYTTQAQGRGLRVIITGAGGAAQLPGMVAALTLLPVLGVPVESVTLRGIDSLLSIVQMPAGVPTATVAVGRAGAVNAALFAARLPALDDVALAARLVAERAARADEARRAGALLRADHDLNGGRT
jgi:5-(carboxyamino)imidazole ribonucleotide mutase